MTPVIAAFAAFILSVLVGWSSRPVAATRVLATRHSALPVWLGVTTALTVQAAVAALIGSQLARLPHQPVALAGAGLFVVAALLLPRGARHADTTQAERERAYADRVIVGQRGHRAVLASFVLVCAAAEWGNLAQLLLATLTAGGGPVVPVLAGSGLGFATVTGTALRHGDWLLHRARMAFVRYLAAAACAVLALASALLAVG